MYIIAFEGLDASGKETQSKILQSRLNSQGYKTYRVSFPRYETPVGKLIGEILKSKISISKEALHLLFEVDRLDFQEKINQLKQQNYDFLILDRYTISNLAYCLANGLEIDWIKNIQSKLIKPDMVFFLDISAETSFIRKSNRDNFESSIRLLKQVEIAYKYLCEEMNKINKDDYNIYRIDGEKESAEIHEEIMSYVKCFCLL